MPWQSLGIVSLGEDWQAFPNDVVNSETFRITHFTTADPSINSCHLSRYFALPAPGGRFSPWRRIYSSNDSQIIHLPIPMDYREQGILVFTLQVKLKFPYYPIQWQIEIEALY